jgi:hypothetical protein
VPQHLSTASSGASTSKGLSFHQRSIISEQPPSASSNLASNRYANNLSKITEAAEEFSFSFKHGDSARRMLDENQEQLRDENYLRLPDSFHASRYSVQNSWDAGSGSPFHFSARPQLDLSVILVQEKVTLFCLWTLLEDVIFHSSQTQLLIIHKIAREPTLRLHLRNILRPPKRPRHHLPDASSPITVPTFRAHDQCNNTNPHRCLNISSTLRSPPENHSVRAKPIHQPPNAQCKSPSFRAIATRFSSDFAGPIFRLKVNIPRL